ncbi:MAG: hypothetical protein GXY33_16365 [Phycisphaerae bacterium]|nr:hypothetical protein [Phycisphaerae bacterium]
MKARKNGLRRLTWTVAALVGLVMVVAGCERSETPTNGNGDVTNGDAKQRQTYQVQPPQDRLERQERQVQPQDDETPVQPPQDQQQDRLDRLERQVQPQDDETPVQPPQDLPEQGQ